MIVKYPLHAVVIENHPPVEGWGHAKHGRIGPQLLVNWVRVPARFYREKIHSAAFISRSNQSASGAQVLSSALCMITDIPDRTPPDAIGRPGGHSRFRSKR